MTTIQNSASLLTSRNSLALVLFAVIAISNIGTVISQEQRHVFGTQCSFAITGPNLDGCDPSLLDHRQNFYNDYMAGCYKHYSKYKCRAEEESRLEMNVRQPQSMVNMTSTGYRKMKAPDSLLKLLTDFWEANKGRKYIEDWGDGSIYTNHWESPTYMLSVENERLVGGGKHLKTAIWDAAIDGIAEWTGGVAKLRPVSLYGIREYTAGAVLSPHVDRVPLVSSGIVNVAQDVDEPWPLEVYDRNGHAVNITMEPGDMILYESHSVIHGRPFPLKGRFYANVFIHFEPFDGWESARQESKLGNPNGDIPPYILPGSPEEKYFKAENPNGWSKFFAEGDEPPVAEYASNGELDKLKEVAAIDPRVLLWEDENGWTPLHEAARYGQLEVVQYLIDSGASINAQTGDGSTPLRIAINDMGEHHEVVKFLTKLGAEDHGVHEDERFEEGFYQSADDDEYEDYEDEDDSTPTIVTDQVPSIVDPEDDEEL